MVTGSSPCNTTAFQFANLMGAGRMPPETTDSLIAHFRRAKRSVCEIQCDIAIVLNGGFVFDIGVATLTNFSPTGALLTDIHLQGGVLPLAPFTLTLRLRGENYEGIRIDASPARFTERGFSMGVRFDDLAVELS